MSLMSQVIDDGATVVIAISGRFDFGVHREFRSAYEKADTTIQNPKYIIDLKDAEHMDSSALGMLLLLREHAGGDRADVLIAHPSPVIREILDIANFGKLFKIQK